MSQSREFGNFIFIDTNLPYVTLISPKPRGDERGFFIETYRHDTFSKAGIVTSFVQDNHSGSRDGTLRGLHIQYPRYQEKLVRAVVGEVLDIAVQVYPENSPNFGRYVAVPLGVNNRHMLHIGQGRYIGDPVLYAHGYFVISPFAEVLYKASDIYTPTDELGLNPFDSKVAIDYTRQLNPQAMLEGNLINQRDFNWPNLEKLASQIWARIPERRVVVPVKKYVKRKK